MLVAQGYNTVVTYWGAPVQDGYGRWTFSAPQEILCRWEDSTEEYLDQQGNERVSRSIVWIPESINPEIGGYLFKGSSVADDPTGVAGALPIQRVDNIPDLRNLQSEQRAYL